MTRRSLPDVNVLIALVDSEHEHHRQARDWFLSRRGTWGLCPLTETGFIRISTNPAIQRSKRTIEQSIAILQSLKGRFEHYLYWEINPSWIDLTAPFAERISGHRQVTDAYLLGLAIKEDGVLVTFDRRLKHLAGTEFARNVEILE